MAGFIVVAVLVIVLITGTIVETIMERREVRAKDFKEAREKVARAANQLDEAWAEMSYGPGTDMAVVRSSITAAQASIDSALNIMLDADEESS